MNNIIKRVWNQNRMTNIEDLSGMAFQAESGGHTFEISGTDDAGDQIELSGTVAGVFVRPDMTDVALTGTAEDGIVSVTLTDDCYAVAGRFGLTIFVTDENDQKVAVYACVGTVTRTSTGSVAGDAPQDVVDLINAIAAAVATIPADYTDLMSAIAPTYADNAVYTVGSYAWYDGKLYKCTTAITLGETFDATKWAAIPISSAVQKMADEMIAPNLADGTTYTTKKKVDFRTGDVVTQNYYAVTDYIDVSPCASIVYSRMCSRLSNVYGGIAFYDSNKNFITDSGIRGKFNQTADHYEMETITVPSGAVYIRLTTRLSLPNVEVYDLAKYDQTIPQIVKRNSENIAALMAAPASYYEAEIADTIAKARDAITSPALVFAWSTDQHRYSANADGVQNFAKMIQNTKAVAQSVPLDFVLSTGDLTDGNQPQETTIARAYECLDQFRSIGVPYIVAMGNHDENYLGTGHPYLFTLAECFKAYYTATHGAAFNANENGMDYYVDFFDRGVRLISLCANNVTTQDHGYSFGTSTAAWLTDALDTDLKVLIVIHQSPINTQVYAQQATKNAAAVNAAISDFISGGGSLIMISGHSHRDIAFVSPYLSVMQDCQRFTDTAGEVIGPNDENPTEITGFIDNIVKPARIAGTASEDAWTLAVYKPITNDLDLIRFGAGADRYFHATPIAPTTLTTRLSSVSWSSSDTSIATVSNGTVTGVSSGRCAIIAKDTSGNYECWIIEVQ